MRPQLDKLAMMANQIAQFFRSYPHDEAVAGIAHHIEQFWTPKMRQAFKDGLDDLPDVHPLVREAVSPEVEARSPAEKATAGPGKIGELGAVDAG
jgi:formate dehydrogenase subunit delta